MEARRVSCATRPGTGLADQGFRLALSTGRYRHRLGTCSMALPWLAAARPAGSVTRFRTLAPAENGAVPHVAIFFHISALAVGTAA